MEETKNKNAIWILENPTVERMEYIKKQIADTSYVDKVRYAETRIIFEDVSDEDFIKINDYFNKVNEGFEPTPGEPLE